MAFPTHGHRVGSSYALDGKRNMLRMQNGKIRAIVHRPDQFRTFSIRTQLITEAQADEWDAHFDAISDDGTDTITFDGTVYTCRYLNPPERIHVGPDLFQVFVRLREVA